MNNVVKGAACLVVSAFGFAVMAACVRGADSFGACLPSPEKAFFRNLVAMAVAAGMFLPALRGGDSGRGGARPAQDRWTASAWVTLVLRAAFGTLGIFLNFYALSHVPIADAMALNKTAPFFTVLFSALFLGERVTWRQGACILGAFAGAMCVVKPGFAATALVPACAGFASGLCAGAAYACVRKLGVMKIPPKAIVLFFSAFSCLASVPFLVFDWHPIAPMQLVVLMGAGVGAAIGQFGVTAAYRFAEPRRIVAWDYVNILFVAFFGLVLFGQVPDAVSVIGMALIVFFALRLRRVG